MMISIIFAALLSLTSTNDYIHIALPTNGSYSIDGVGVGPNGDYRVMRREDWLFLEECARERFVVYDWLSSTPNTNSVPTGDFSNYVTICPWPDGYMFNALGSQFLSLYGSVTNHIYDAIKCPKEGSYASVTKEVADAYSDDFIFTNMYANGIMPASRRLETFNAMAASRGYSWILPYPELVLGVLTNAYSDIIANDRTVWRQVPKYGTSGYNETMRTERECSTYASGYSRARKDFNYISSLPYEEKTYYYPSYAWTTVDYFYHASIDVMKTAYCGFDSSGAVERSGDGKRIDNGEYIYDSAQDFAVMFPNPIGGAQIVSTDAAFAIMRYEHVIVRYDQGQWGPYEYVTNIVKRVMKPIVISPIESHDGLTTYGFSLPVVATRSDVIATVKDQIMGQRWLENQINTPTSPTTYKQSPFNQDIVRIREDQAIYLERVIGVFKMKWNSRMAE